MSRPPLIASIVGLGAVMVPGPVSTAIVSESTRRGFAVGPLVATGHVLLEFAVVVLLALGVSAGLRRPLIVSAVSLLGGTLLLWMGGSMVWGAKVKLLNNRQLLGVGAAATRVNPLAAPQVLSFEFSFV